MFCNHSYDEFKTNSKWNIGNNIFSFSDKFVYWKYIRSVLPSLLSIIIGLLNVEWIVLTCEQYETRFSKSLKFLMSKWTHTHISESDHRRVTTSITISKMKDLCATKIQSLFINETLSRDLIKHEQTTEYFSMNWTLSDHTRL